MSQDLAMYIHNSTSEWVRFADTKLGATLAALGLFVALLVNQSDKVVVNVQKTLDFPEAAMIAAVAAVVIAFTAFVISGASCLVFSVRGVVPRTNIVGKESLIFFGSVANTKQDIWISAIKQLSKEQDEDEILAQVWENSIIARNKFKDAKLALTSLAYTIFFSVLTMLLPGFLVLIR